MALNLNSFATSVSNQVAAIQTQLSSFVSFTSGSILRSTSNSNAAVGIWLQGLALQVMALTRLATSYGSDADSWGLDWGYFRSSATVSVGFVTFSRFTSTTSTLIPVGAIVMTADKTQQFTVVADATNPAWNAVSNGFNLPSGTPSVTVAAQSINAAAAANVSAGTIALMVTAISGVDYVSNSLAFDSGTDPESNSAFKSGFPNYLLSLARSTVGAITGAVQSLQQNVEVQILEGVTYAGATQLGYLTIIVDDGTGAPSIAFMASAGTQINNYRAAGIQFGAFPPSIITVNVSYTLVTAAGFVHSDLVANSEAAVVSFIDALLDGQQLSYDQIYQVIYNSSPGITNVLSLLVNGATADLVPAKVYDVYKVGTVTGL